MNFDEFENKLRSQPPREIPPEWRREILAPLRRRTEAPVAWWRQLLWPHPAAWASLAGAWVAIFALNLAGAPEAASYQAAGKPSPDKLVAYQERQRLWAELALDLSRQPRKPLPTMDRPRSEAPSAEVMV
jgi:hypothetical protein